MDSIGALVRMAESKDFIPKWDTSEPRDKLDVILKDYQLFLKRLLLNDPTILDKIDEAVEDLKKQDQIVANHDFGDIESSQEQILTADDGAQPTADDPTANLFQAYDMELDDDYDIKRKIAPLLEKQKTERLDPLEKARLGLETIKLQKRKEGKND